MPTESVTRETKFSMMKRKLPPLKIPPIQNLPDKVETPKEHPNIPENVKKMWKRTKSSAFGTFVDLVNDVHASKLICRVTIWSGTPSFFYTPAKNSTASNKKKTIISCACFLLYNDICPPGNKSRRTDFLLT